MKRSHIMVVSVVAYLVLTVVVSPWMLIRENDMVKESLAIQREANKVLALLVNVETAYRGYLLTDDKSFLEPLQSSKKIRPMLTELSKMVDDDAAQWDDVNQMWYYSECVIYFAGQVNPKSYDRDDLKTGKRLMDAFRVRWMTF